MKEVSKAIATVAEGFSNAVSNAGFNTESGKSLFNKYQSLMMANAIDCTMVNSFVKEAKSLTFDNGVCSVLEAVGMLIESVKYSWLLESACEQIERSNGTYNYINRNAVKLVRPLLEMEEADVVSYIKAGALKDVMYCEGFRRIAKAVYGSTNVCESNRDFTAVHPISFVEKKDDAVHFRADHRDYVIKNGEITEASARELSPEYHLINSLLESNGVTVKEGVVTFNMHNFKIEISEEGKCKKITEGNKVHEYTVDQLREHNCLLVQNYGPQRRMAEEQLLEAIANTCENYDNVMLMDAVTIFSTPSHKFIVIESGNNAHAESIWSSRTPKWSCTSNILETVNFIKKKTNVDLSEQYAEKIQNLIAEAEKKDAETLKESLRQNEIQLRREKIEKLTQQFKNDPVKLAVLSKAAADLSALED